HVQEDYNFYSVPYEYVREDVDVRITADVIELYFKYVRIASHPRKRKSEDSYATNLDHLPDHHRRYLDHNPENNRKWAKEIGPNMERLVEHILKTNVEKKALNILNGLRNTASKKTSTELEAATKTLLEISSHPTVAVLKSILARQKKKQADKQLVREPQTEDYGFTRGATYFGRDKK
ncbi:IS21 family transposase, partial [Planococcus sp. CP5-4]|uniref:Mu transposase domain-containing protein n=1 Tax=Planococcus sp. CP5-4 TaxID=2849036 RepID=UPI0037EC0CCD|nr:IS21 family transposase [Planococcus sp. CP5-4]